MSDPLQPTGCSGALRPSGPEERRSQSAAATSLIGPGLLGLLFLLLTISTWRRWGDILVDFPLHLYTPWRLSLGDLLYRDVANLHGPFSETYHGLLFRIFGPTVGTLIWASLGLLVAQLALLYAGFKRESGNFVATLLCCLFLVAFAFAHYTGIGTYNYVLSYNYELIHGLFFSTLSLIFLSKCNPGQADGSREAIFSGLFFGLAALTKQEVILGLSLAVLAGFVQRIGTSIPTGAARESSSPLLSFLAAIGSFLAGAFVPILLFWAFFASTLGAQKAFRVILWPWVALIGTGASANAFHRAGLGLDDPMENLAATIQAAGVAVALLLGIVLLFHRKTPKSVRIALGIAFLGIAGWWDWRDVGRGFPLLCPIAIGLLWSEGEACSFALLWTVFGFGLLAKMGINCRIWHYGYVLAMPAALGLAFTLVRVLPRKLERYQVNGSWLGLFLAGILGIGTLQLGWDSWQIYQAKTFSFGSGADRMVTFPPKENARAEAIGRAVDWLDKNASPKATLAALPQGVILNFLSKRPNPTPYLTWIVTEYNTFGENRMLGALQASPPDYIALVHTDTSEYGPRFFGQQGYAQKTMAWVRAHYEPVFLAGHEPFQGEEFGIRLLRRIGSR